jgi:hypothetical protein
MAAKSPKDREYASFFPLFPVWLVDFLKPKWDKANYTNDINGNHLQHTNY